jgi:hypothetical protein
LISGLIGVEASQQQAVEIKVDDEEVIKDLAVVKPRERAWTGFAMVVKHNKKNRQLQGTFYTGLFVVLLQAHYIICVII